MDNSLKKVLNNKQIPKWFIVLMRDEKTKALTAQFRSGDLENCKLWVEQNLTEDAEYEIVVKFIEMNS